jgi:hypothetical protein
VGGREIDVVTRPALGGQLLGLDVAGEVQGVTGVAQFDGDGYRMQCGVGRAELGSVVVAVLA